MRTILALFVLLAIAAPARADRMDRYDGAYDTDSRARYENYAVAYQGGYQAQRTGSQTLVDRLQERTGCDASGSGPASVGCNFYSKSDDPRQMKVRAGFSMEGAVGVGIGMKW